MASVTFDREAALAWLRSPAEGFAHPRAEDYGDFVQRGMTGPVVCNGVDESQLEPLVHAYQDEGPGFGDVRIHAWLDDLIINDEPGIHLSVDVPVPGDESMPLRLSGTWAGLRGWVQLHPSEEELPDALADYLAAVANDARAVLIHAKAAVQAGVLA